ncbi:hypothetical protein BDZ91DRAFT_708511 [Kalaharituber pfeilii]|nr:hypothetical protein BDZ91DRAFT_708511 [Kalaharituber pfeilii]
MWQHELNLTYTAGVPRRRAMRQHKLNLIGSIRQHEIWQNELNLIRMAQLPSQCTMRQYELN